jgi:hypothetical protein
MSSRGYPLHACTIFLSVGVTAAMFAAAPPPPRAPPPWSPRPQLVPLVWLLVAPNMRVRLDRFALSEFNLSVATLLHHGEAVDMHVMARDHDRPMFRSYCDPPRGSRFTFHAYPDETVMRLFSSMGIVGGSHHSRIGGATKLLLPVLFPFERFAFLDTDTMFVRPVSTLLREFGRMQPHHLMAASSIPTSTQAYPGFPTRINSGVMLFRGVDREKWVGGVAGAIRLNQLSCERAKWRGERRQSCLTTKNSTQVVGDQEVFSAIISAIHIAHALPPLLHQHQQGWTVKNVPGVTVLHYKNHEAARRLGRELGLV